MGMLLHRHFQGEKKTPPVEKKIEEVVEKEVKSRRKTNDTGRKN